MVMVMNDDNWQQKILQLHCHPVIIYHGKRCEIDARAMTNDQSYSINPEIDIGHGFVLIESKNIENTINFLSWH